MQDGEDELEASRQAEVKQRGDIDKELQRAEGLKGDRAAKMHQQNTMDNDMGKVGSLLMLDMLYNTYYFSPFKILESKHFI